MQFGTQQPNLVPDRLLAVLHPVRLELDEATHPLFQVVGPLVGGVPLPRDQRREERQCDDGADGDEGRPVDAAGGYIYGDDEREHGHRGAGEQETAEQGEADAAPPRLRRQLAGPLRRRLGGMPSVEAKVLGGAVVQGNAGLFHGSPPGCGEGQQRYGHGPPRVGRLTPANVGAVAYANDQFRAWLPGVRIRLLGQLSDPSQPCGGASSAGRGRPRPRRRR
jgi:hypothetical protein